ncbi:MAG: NADH-quinone oxidoreductase subunit F [Deltaproteobacteria bacterium]|jgi:NADH:ubiquinone oxidoreductase subunit F (NADH-binding)/(2Fe-2S) ferredoxin|nr:MAG: NADH-quinone oxidoreductase subunit F [Deltaproteobacteria bacterium]
MRITSKDDLQKIRAEVQSSLYVPSTLKLNIGMASCGIAAGAKEVYDKAHEIFDEQNVLVARTGCLGLCEEEPLVDIQAPGKPRIVYRRVSQDNIAELVEAHQKAEYLEKYVLGQMKDPRSILEDDIENPLSAAFSTNGIPTLEEIPFYDKQLKIALRNCGYIDPETIEEYIGRGGYLSLFQALHEMEPEEVIETIKISGLRGRGGGGFPTGIKWASCRKAHGEKRYVICNADEGDPGAYMDRSVLEGDPHSVLEGMIIGAYAIGSHEGFIYVRNEYPLAVVRLVGAIKQAESCGLLGNDILGSGFNFTITISTGAGAFVCGESTALMRSLEGKVGRPRAKYIHTVEKGYHDSPSTLNNVETWANVPAIIVKGATWYASLGTEKSKGTKVFSLVGKVKNTGLVEVPMGTSLRTIIFDIGGGILKKKEFKAVQTGGPSGGCVPKALLDLPVDYERLTQAGSMMGSGGMIVMDQDTCMVDVARYFLEFLQEESCGQCVPCREGIKRLLQILTDICAGKGEDGDIELLENISDTVVKLSLCALGGTAPNPILTTLAYFRDEYETHIYDKKCHSGVCKELFYYEIDEENCNGCHVCFRKCPQDAISGEKKELHTIDQELCIKCAICYEACKFDAIAIK